MHDEHQWPRFPKALFCLWKRGTWDMATGQVLVAPPSFAVPFLFRMIHPYPWEMKHVAMGSAVFTIFSFAP
jgi:hypothetical protein